MLKPGNKYQELHVVIRMVAERILMAEFSLV
jgi:hypothetical protein